MRIMMVQPGPGFSVLDVYSGWLRAFRDLGCETLDFNLSDRLSFYSNAGRLGGDGEFIHFMDFTDAATLAARGLEAACYRYQPDIVFVVSGFYVPLDTLDVIRARGSSLVLLHTESPYEDDRQLVRAAHASLNLLNDPTNIERFAALGPALYAPHAYDPQVHFPGPAGDPQFASDFCFVGTGFPNRVRLLEAVDWTGIDVALAGMWQTLSEDSPLRKFVGHDIGLCMDNAEAVQAYRGTKVSANIYRREAERPELERGWAMGPREIELAACGTFFLREPRGEGDLVLPMVPTFVGAEEFEELLRWYLDHPILRETIAAKARERIAERTFHHNARLLLAALDL